MPELLQVSPIAGSPVGGITIALRGKNFQPDSEVYFGNSPSPDVTYVSSTEMRAVLPATQINSPPLDPTGEVGTVGPRPGTVDVSIIDPDGLVSTLAGGFTYVTMEQRGQAEVLGISPLTVIEGNETVVTIRGRNLINAYDSGMVALRGPSRASVTISDSAGSQDEETGIESLTVTLQVTASPPLEQSERLVIQVLASSRPDAGRDGVFESSKQMFIVLPDLVPVPLAYSANLTPGKPNLVVVAGRNLEGCALDFGSGATVNLQKSNDRILSGIVTLPEGEVVAPQLSLLNISGAEFAQYDMSVELTAEQPPPTEEPGTGAINLTLKTVPGQQLVAPTEDDSAVFNLNGSSPTSLFFDWIFFEITILDVVIVLPIVHEVHLIPLFDGGRGQDLLSNTPVLAQVGKLLRLRGVGILVALHVEIIIHIRVVLIIGFLIEIWDFGLFNEFPEFEWAFGSIIIGVEVEVEVLFIFAFLLAAVLPQGRLIELQSILLVFGLFFNFSTDGNHLHFGVDYRVDFTRIGPSLNLQPCDGRFQLASDNGQTVFPDAFGGNSSFYFPREEGECCVPWNFDLRLMRLDLAGTEVVDQESFSTEFCLTAAPSLKYGKVVITSANPAPSGFPPTLVMDIGNTALVMAQFVIVDLNGVPVVTEPPVDVRDAGYDVKFFLVSLTEVVLSRVPLEGGIAHSIQEGDNEISARLKPREGEQPEIAIWPGSALGFNIADPVSHGEEGEVVAGSLAVTVNPLPSPIKVEPTLAFRDSNNNLVEAPTLFNIFPDLSDPQRDEPVREVERYEPFETQPKYVLAVKLTELANVPSSAFPVKLKVKVGTPFVLTHIENDPSPTVEAPLKGIYGGARSNADKATQFFSGKLAQGNSEITVTIPSKPAEGAIVEVVDLTASPNLRFDIQPYTNEDAANGHFVPPGKAVRDKDVLFSIDVTITSDTADVTATMVQIGVNLAVSNGETFEEYRRVFKEVQTILDGAGATLKNSAQTLYTALSAPNAVVSTTLKSNGAGLWTAGCSAAHTLRDDRPIYWARLRSICAFRAFGKRHSLTLSQVDGLIPDFEWPSRGLEPTSGIIAFTGVGAVRKAIITGFDPFQLDLDINTSNPSGLVALDFNGRTIGSQQVPVAIRAAVFPVRYKDFDIGLVEKAIGDKVTGSLTSIAMLVTCSQNGIADYYDIERWATRKRVNGGDNNNKLASASTTPIPAGPGYLESTLPYDLVIVSAEKLPGPNGDAPFVIDQSYRVEGYTIVVGGRTISVGISVNRDNFVADPTKRVMPSTPDSNHFADFRPEPLLDDVDQAAFTKKVDKPNPTKILDEGSGGNFLSNEIYYRTALVRDTNRPTLASGHFHIPPTSNAPQTKGQSLINGVQTAINRLLDKLPRLIAAADVSFPQTQVNTTSAPLTFSTTNETAEAIQIAGVSVSQPFAVQLPGALPITLNPGSTLSLPVTFTPTAAGVSTGTLRLMAAQAPLPSPNDRETVWVDDSLPAGANADGSGEGWNFVGAVPTPFSGTASHLSNLAEGLHQHYFSGATQTLAIGGGDVLFAYVYLDPHNTPSEIMLQWNDGTWEHRAYWGANDIPTGAGGTVVAARVFMGALPPTGQWVRLEVPARMVGLEGKTLNGMAFTLFGGRAVWDRAGVVRGLPLNDTIWVDEALPAGAVTDGLNETWKWITAAPKPFFGFAAHQSEIFWSGVHQHLFHSATSGLQINSGDTLFAHVYLDPQFVPSEVMLQWNDGTWEHRAYWGANLIEFGVDGTKSRRYMGPLPATGRWIRLEVPASLVGLEGQTLNGTAYTLFNGRASWDREGKTNQPSTAETVWVEDSVPAGATLAGDGEGWNFVGAVPAPFSGVSSHMSNIVAGFHQHHFTGATQTLAIDVGDTLFAYVYLDPQFVPSEIMLQWNDGTWEHRAYWGANQINAGTNGTPSRRFMGALPAAGQWVRLEVPASLVGLEGQTLNGMAFTLFDGRALWDRAGKVSVEVLSATPLVGEGV